MTEHLSYTPINDFPLKWRFAEDDTKWTVLQSSDLALFRPLAEDSARHIWSTHVTIAAEHLMEIVLKTAPPNRDQFGTQLLVTDDNWSSDEEHQRVASVFRKHVQVADSSVVYFFWHASCAVETTWDILLRYWSDFCYPSDESNVASVLEAGNNLYYIEGTVWIGPSPHHDQAT
ncbi:DUF2947 family protein [Adhaeretor mobilis]|uniref:Uncharacterized protein n=1 Tax=Adhaeretor mobilis TaxID=1930276 RepID=A0A517MRW2_9BACT|nr:DUF2947 family protein [Adhaeretor mobilis]QDS97616.1 hypothetical protein HG15A2_08790 [Adhaeretor mobilis]